LTLCRIRLGADKALESGHVPKEEGRDSKTAARPADLACALVIEVELTGSMSVARYAQVHCIPDISAELDGMAAASIGPVVYKLELLLLFVERTVTAIHIKTRPGSERPFL
jgi:hypothetical protein